MAGAVAAAVVALPAVPSVVRAQARAADGADAPAPAVRAPVPDAAPEGEKASGADEAADSEPATSAPPPEADDGLSDAPIDESQFTLDLDENQDIGVEWPDLDKKPEPPRLVTPGQADGAATADGTPTPSATAPAPATATRAEDGAESAPPADAVVAASSDGVSVATAPVLAPGAPSPDATTPDGSGPDAAPMVDDGAEHRYSVMLNGLDAIADDQFDSRFKGLSLLEAEDGKPANIAQINRRMRQDSDLIERILDAKGYYDAIVRSSLRPVETGGDRLQVLFAVRPGTRYSLSRITLPGLAAATARVPALATAFPVKVGDPVDADAILAGRQALATALDENGFPFSSVAQPAVTIDHETQKGDLELVVRAGGYRRFGTILLDDEAAKLFTPRHLQRMARFERGDVYMASDVEDLRRAIVATGLVSTASVKAQDAGDGEHADIAVATMPAPPRTIAGLIGYGTGEGYQIEANWQHRNFFPPEGALKLSGMLGTKEQGAGVTVRRNNFPRRDHVLTGTLSFQHQNYDAYEAQTVNLGIGLERQTNILFQKRWVWSAGAELIGTREQGVFSDALQQSTRDYVILSVPLSLTYDASDDLLDPTRGFRLGGRFNPEIAQQGGTVYNYVKVQVDGSAYLPVTDRVVLASRVRLGSILGGVDFYSIAPSRRFYAGGGASVRGYAYQAIGPQDDNNNAVGGKSLAEFSLEARVRFGAFGVVPFLDAGNIATGFLPRLSDVRYGAGLGLRYYSTFGPIRIDIGTPINPQPGDSRLGVYVSLGQAF